MPESECCKTAAKEATKAERRRVREILATLPEAVRNVASEAIFGPQAPPPGASKPKWVDLSVENR
jgi:hypothetical protein